MRDESFTYFREAGLHGKSSGPGCLRIRAHCFVQLCQAVVVPLSQTRKV